MSDITYRSLVWLAYRLASIFAVGLPLVLTVWSIYKKEGCIVRLLSIYWKISSLMAICILLLTNDKPLGYLILLISQFLITISIWFWVDLNEELGDLPPWRPLSLTVRVWRWSLTSSCALTTALAAFSLPCLRIISNAKCLSWLEPPMAFHNIANRVLGFLLGANWNEPLAGFIGYLGLIAYTIGIIQWVLIRLPKQGRVAGGF